MANASCVACSVRLCVGKAAQLTWLMLSSLPNRCVHHHRPTARVGFCLPNIGVPLTVCLFLSNRRPVIFKRAPTACDHHFLADTMITCSPGMEHEMVSPPPIIHRGPSVYRSSGGGDRERLTVGSCRCVFRQVETSVINAKQTLPATTTPRSCSNSVR